MNSAYNDDQIDIFKNQEQPRTDASKPMMNCEVLSGKIEAKNDVETDEDLRVMIKQLKSRTNVLLQNVKAFSNVEPLRSQFQCSFPLCSSSVL